MLFLDMTRLSTTETNSPPLTTASIDFIQLVEMQFYKSILMFTNHWLICKNSVVQHEEKCVLNALDSLRSWKWYEEKIAEATKDATTPEQKAILYTNVIQHLRNHKHKSIEDEFVYALIVQHEIFKNCLIDYVEIDRNEMDQIQVVEFDYEFLSMSKFVESVDVLLSQWCIRYKNIGQTEFWLCDFCEFYNSVEYSNCQRCNAKIDTWYCRTCEKNFIEEDKNGFLISYLRPQLLKTDETCPVCKIDKRPNWVGCRVHNRKLKPSFTGSSPTNEFTPCTCLSRQS